MNLRSIFSGPLAPVKALAFTSVSALALALALVLVTACAGGSGTGPFPSCSGVGLAGAACGEPPESIRQWFEPPESIRQWFEAPDSLKGDFGDYRSPLVFDNGDTVRTRAQWELRREEIRSNWMAELGQWPEILHGGIEFLDTLRMEGYLQCRVRLEWLPGQFTEGYLLLPEWSVPDDAAPKAGGRRRHRGEKRIPAVITVYYEPETAAGLGDLPNRDFAVQAVRRGIAALSLGTSETTASKHYSLYYPSFQACGIEPLSVLAWAAANALEALASLPMIDGGRIGIIGHSYGGKWAMAASCLYDRFACAVWGDPGVVLDETKGTYINYWAPWYLGYFNPPWDTEPDLWAQDGYLHARGAYPRLKEKGMDLHELHSLMAPRPFMVSGGFADGVERWRALSHSVEVNRLLGYGNRVALTLRPSHEPDSLSNVAACDFLEWCLNP